MKINKVSLAFFWVAVFSISSMAGTVVPKFHFIYIDNSSSKEKGSLSPDMLEKIHSNLEASEANKNDKLFLFSSNASTPKVITKTGSLESFFKDLISSGNTYFPSLKEDKKLIREKLNYNFKVSESIVMDFYLTERFAFEMLQSYSDMRLAGWLPMELRKYIAEALCRIEVNIHFMNSYQSVITKDISEKLKYYQKYKIKFNIYEIQ